MDFHWSYRPVISWFLIVLTNSLTIPGLWYLHVFDMFFKASKMLVFKFCCPELCFFLPLSLHGLFRSMSNWNTSELLSNAELASFFLHCHTPTDLRPGSLPVACFHHPWGALQTHTSMLAPPVQHTIQNPFDLSFSAPKICRLFYFRKSFSIKTLNKIG